MKNKILQLKEIFSINGIYSIDFPFKQQKIVNKIFVQVLGIIKEKKQSYWKQTIYSIDKNLELELCYETMDLQSKGTFLLGYIGDFLGVFKSDGYDLYPYIFSINTENNAKIPPLNPYLLNGFLYQNKYYYYDLVKDNYSRDDAREVELKCEENKQTLWCHHKVKQGILYHNNSKNLISIRELRWDTEADAMIQELSFIDLQTGKLQKTVELMGYTRVENIISYQNLVIICLSKGICCFDADSCQLIWEWKWIPKHFDYNSLNMDFKNTILHIIAGYEYHQLNVFDGEVLLSNDLKPSLSKCKFYRVPKGKLPQQDNFIPIVSDTHLIFTQWEYMFFVNIVTGDIDHYYLLENALFNSHLYFLGDKLVARIHNYGKGIDSYPSLKVYELPQFT